MYIIHLYYCTDVEDGFYSDVVECLPIDQESWFRLKYFLYNTKCHMMHKIQLPEVGIKRPGRRI